MTTEPDPLWAVGSEDDLDIAGADDARDMYGPTFSPTPRTGLYLVQRETTRNRVTLRSPVQVAIHQDNDVVRLNAEELRAQAQVMLKLADQLDRL